MKAVLIRAALAAAILLGAPGRPPARSEEPAPQGSYAEANEHYRRGVSLFRQRDFAAASEELTAATRLNPKFGAAYYLLGLCDSQQAKIDAAVRDLKAALANTRDTKLLAFIHYNLGVLYLRSGNKDSSDQEYRAAVELEPALLSHPIVALPPAPPPAGAPAAVERGPARSPFLPLALLTALAALAVFAARGRWGSLSDSAAPPAALETPQDLQALRRLTVSWVAEPELAMTSPPRPLRFARVKSALVFGACLLAGALLAGSPWTLAKRWLVLRQGAPGTGIVQRLYSVRHYTRSGHYDRRHLVLSYPPSPGESSTADVEIGDSGAVSPGQELPIHSLPGRPGWAVLDDDFGHAARQTRVFLITTAFLAAMVPITFLLALPELRKQRRLLSLGRPAAAYVERIEPGYKGAATAFLCYESGGELRRSSCRIAAQNFDPPLAAGQVVSVLIDPDDPQSLAIYRATSWRVDAG